MHLSIISFLGLIEDKDSFMVQLSNGNMSIQIFAGMHYVDSLFFKVFDSCGNEALLLNLGMTESCTINHDELQLIIILKDKTEVIIEGC